LDITVSLVSEGIAENVSAHGNGPSGGLSIAAVLTKEPHLFSAIVLKVMG
jgi:prolyl oligopeptidase PreP (S9A serine peptidase family)